MVTASLISSIFVGSAILATPPAARMSAGTRSSAITAAAPVDSATRAWSAVTTSMITPPLSISARPALTRNVAVSRIGTDVIRPLRRFDVAQSPIVCRGVAVRSGLPADEAWRPALRGGGDAFAEILGREQLVLLGALASGGGPDPFGQISAHRPPDRPDGQR